MHDVLHEALTGPVRNTGHVEVGSPLGGGLGGLGGVVSVVAHLAEIGVGSDHTLHHRANGRGTSIGVRRVDDTEHAFGAVGGNGAVEEDRIGVVDDLLKGEVLELNTRGERRIGSLVARSKLRALGDGVVVSTPDELDGITDGSVDGEGDVTKDTLGRGNPDDMGLAGLGGSVLGSVLGGSQRELGLALLNAVVKWVASPVVASRAVGGRRLGLIGGGWGTVLRGGGGGVGREALVLATISGEGGGGSPGARRQHGISRSWRRVFAGSREHTIAVPGMLDQNGEGRSKSDRVLTARRYQT